MRSASTQRGQGTGDIPEREGGREVRLCLQARDRSDGKRRGLPLLGTPCWRMSPFAETREAYARNV